MKEERVKQALRERPVQPEVRDGVRYTKEQIEQMTPEELKVARVDLENAVADIKQQILDANIDYSVRGIEADPDWLKRATFAKKHIGKLFAFVNLQLSKHKMARQEKGKAENESFERLFISVAKESLNDQIFEHLVKRTKERMSE